MKTDILQKPSSLRRRSSMSTLKGTLWKRRGGFGGRLAHQLHITNPWKKRAFILVNHVLSYYEEEDVANVINRGDPRGFLDLREPGTRLISGRPIDMSPTRFTIIIKSRTADVKWKLCAMTGEEQNLWLNILNEAMNNEGTWQNEDPLRDMKVSTRLSSSDSLLKKLIKKKPRMNFIRPRPDGSKLAKEQMIILGILGVITSSFIGIYAFQPPFWHSIFSILVINIVCFILLQKNAKSHKKEMKRLVDESEKLYENLNDEYNNWGSEIGKLMPETGVKVKKEPRSPANSIKSKLSLFSDDEETPFEREDLNEEKKGGSDVDSDDGELRLGASLPNAKSIDLPQMSEIKHAWEDGDGALFRVRMGPNYSRTKRKEPSGPALYELFACDIYKTPCRINHMARRVELPFTDIDTGHPHIPAVFVVNCQLPQEAPAWLGSSDDGPGYHVVFYYKIKQETIDHIKHIAAAPPSIRVLADYCERAPNEPAVRGKFKAIAIVENIDVLGLPSMVNRFNGKPVLITNSGNLIVGEGYMEMDINVHMFAFAARKGLHGLLSKFEDMIMSVGFVVEGRGDTEQPEQMLGCSRLLHVNPLLAHDIN